MIWAWANTVCTEHNVYVAQLMRNYTWDPTRTVWIHIWHPTFYTLVMYDIPYVCHNLLKHAYSILSSWICCSNYAWLYMVFHAYSTIAYMISDILSSSNVWHTACMSSRGKLYSNIVNHLHSCSCMSGFIIIAIKKMRLTQAAFLAKAHAFSC